MTSYTLLTFGPYQFDPAQDQLCKDGQPLKLRRKTASVLGYLLTRPDQLVSKAELFATLWPDTAVGDASLAAGIRELRKRLAMIRSSRALLRRYMDEDIGGWPASPPLRQSRVLSPPPSPAEEVQDSEFKVPHFQPIPNPQSPTPTFIGRDAELTQLHDWFVQVQTGTRQLVFVAGEPGIGKTTLLDAFVEQLGQDSQCWIGRGQCIESYGNGTGYLPLLEVLSQWADGPQQAELQSVLGEVAPTWLVQLPRLVDEGEFERVHQQAAYATQTRMLQELAAALEQLATERVVVLVLEDLHWSDASTLEWLATIARRREETQLYILGTYRPVEVLADGHPLGRLLPELRVHGQCQELSLTGLSEVAIETYVEQRFPNSALPTRLSEVLEQRTGGNPLFLVNVLNELISQEVLVQNVPDGEAGGWSLQRPLTELPSGVPANLRQLLQNPMQRLRV